VLTCLKGRNNLRDQVNERIRFEKITFEEEGVAVYCVVVLGW